MKTLYKCFLTVFIFCVTNHSFAQTNIFPSTGAAGIGTTTPDANGANTTLSNLTAPTAVNVDLLPIADNTINLGSVSNSWKNIYLDGSLYLGGSRFLSNKAGTGTGNTVVGAAVLNANTKGINNTGVGFNALFSNTTGKYNTANGYQALQFNITGNSNTATGYKALQNNTTGSSNVANGLYALINNTTGYSNMAIGERALASNTVGHNLVAVGDSALFNQGGTSGGFYGNTAIGSKTLYSNTTGYFNTANGSNALYSNTTGYFNTANGYEALHSNTTGSYNTANGGDALASNTTGSYNTANGNGALSSSTSGVYNTAIGDNTDVGDSNYSYSTALGYAAFITASDQVRIGSIAIASIGGYKAWTNLSDGRVKKNIKANVPGLAFINLLKPITYNLDLDAADKIIQRPAIKDKDGKTIQPSQEQITSRQIQQQVICTGFIAQEVEASAKKIGYEFDGVDAAKNDKDLYGLRYSEFVVPLVKAVQELSKMNDSKAARIDSLEKQNTDLQKQFINLKNLVLQIQQTQQRCSPCNAAATSNAIQQNNITLNNTASLEQNIPNPFTNTTTISYYLPNKFSSAQIIITYKNGKQLKQLNLLAAGKGIIHVDASTLAAGAYNYSLYVDGRLIASKQMILAK